MRKKISKGLNLERKEVKVMKKLICLMIFSMFVVGGMFSQASAELIAGTENMLYFHAVESFFDANGVQKEVSPVTSPEVGDHFMGIINIQNIDTISGTHWFQSGQDQLSGIFAQEIRGVVLGPDPYDPSGTQTLPHLVLGPPAVSVFTSKDGTTVDISGMLSGNEMISLFHQTGAGTTVFEENGNMLDDVTKATDGTKWLSVGYTTGFPGPDGVVGTADDFLGDPGYFYSHVSIFAPLINFTGETWAQVDSISNNTGYALAPIGDPNENEIEIMICGAPGCLLNEIYLSAELELNPQSIDIYGPGGILTTDKGGPLTPNPNALSPWDISVNDPAHVNPIPEPATILLVGVGLLGLGIYGRKRMM